MAATPATLHEDMTCAGYGTIPSGWCQGTEMVRIHRLIWDDWNEEHVARHGIDQDEVEKVSRNDPYITRARDNPHRIIGQTDAGRFVTAYVAPRLPGVFYVVTAREATAGERRTFRRR